MYGQRLRREIDRWVLAGLLPAETAALLLKDIETRGSRFGVSQVLLVLAGVFLSVALLLLIAANWEFIPRIVRLCAVIALIWVLHLGGGFLKTRGKSALAAASLLMGTAAFGGGLSLAGQMYHISGDFFSMFAVWLAATVLTAAVFRSGAVTVAAGLLAFALCWAAADTYGEGLNAPNLLLAPALAVVIGVLAFWTGEEKASHFSFLLVTAWTCWLYSCAEGVTSASIMTVAGFAVFVVMSLRASLVGRFSLVLAGAVPFYALLVANIGLFLLHVETKGAVLAMSSAAGLAAGVVALALGGRENAGVRWQSYIAIASIILFLSSETIGSIIGTSGFFLVAGLVACLLAFIVLRVERRMSGSRSDG